MLEQASRSLDDKIAAWMEKGSGELPRLSQAEIFVLKQRKRVLYAEVDQRMRDNHLVTFCPNGAQEEIIQFFRTINPKEKRPQIIGWFAGNGVGKTAVMVNILGNLIFGPQPFMAKVGTLDEYIDESSEVNWVDQWGDPPQHWCNLPIFTDWPYPRNIRIISTPANLDDEGAIQLEIDKWWPKSQYESWKGKYGYRSKFKTKSGFSIELKTYDQDPKEHESKTLGMVIADEPVPESLWGPTVSRLRRGGIIFLGMTPLFGSAFLYDEVVAKAEVDETVKYLYSDVENNCVEHGRRGILTHQAIEWMIARYPAEERESRRTGKFLSLAGKVHRDFDRSVHIICPRKGKPVTDISGPLPSRDFILANPHLFQFYQVVDPHDRKWDAVGYYALDDHNRKYVIDEYPDQSIAEPYHRLHDRRHSYEQMVKDILKPKEKAMGLDEVEMIRIMDPRYASNRLRRGVQQTGLTVAQEWALHYGEGFFTTLNDSFQVGRNALDTNLKIASDNHPLILFFEGYSENHTYALEHWMWDRWEGKAAEKRDINQKPKERHSDFPRLLHYLCTFDPVYSKRSPRQIGWREKLKRAPRGAHSTQMSFMGR